jgi:hypothetical protein
MAAVRWDAGLAFEDAGLAVGPTLQTLEVVGEPKNYFEIRGLASHGTQLAVVGTNGVLSSTNFGRTFRRLMESRAKVFNAVDYGNGLFVAVGANGEIRTSTNSLGWSKIASGTTFDLRDVKYAAGRWVIVGAGGVILTSIDGLQFTKQASGVDIRLNGIAYGDGKWVVVGDSGVILTGNGATWSLIGTDEGSTLYSAAFSSGTFVTTGEFGRTYLSTNGITWKLSRIIGASSLSRVEAAHGLFLTFDAGTTNIYTSASGTGWSKNTLGSPIARVTSVDVLDGRFFASGADENGSFYIKKEVLPESLKLTATIDGNRRAQIQMQVPSAGVYAVFSATPAEASANAWASRGTVNASAAGTVEWTDPDDLESARFYQARKNP